MKGATKLSEKPPVSEALNRRLEKALAESMNQLGTLEPWQEKLFNDEVVKEPQRFIRDYRASRTGIDVDVDMQSVRNYLRFYAPNIYKKPAPQIAVSAFPAANCEPCQAKLPVIRQILKERLENRGFTVLMAKPIEQDALTRFAQEKKLEGTLWVSFGPDAADEADPAHSEGLQYLIHAVMDLQGYSKQDGTLEIFETGSFEHSVSRLLTDFFTEIGAQTDQAQASESSTSQAVTESDSNATSIEIQGIRSYAEYLHLKDRLKAVSEDTGIALEERKVSSGKVVYIAKTEKDAAKGLESLKKALSGASLSSGGDASSAADGARLRLVKASDQRLEMEIRP